MLKKCDVCGLTWSGRDVPDICPECRSELHEVKPRKPGRKRGPAKLRTELYLTPRDRETFADAGEGNMSQGAADGAKLLRAKQEKENAR